jgi:hypothetical protein
MTEMINIAAAGKPNAAQATGYFVASRPRLGVRPALGGGLRIRVSDSSRTQHGLTGTTFLSVRMGGLSRTIRYWLSAGRCSGPVVQHRLLAMALAAGLAAGGDPVRRLARSWITLIFRPLVGGS